MVYGAKFPVDMLYLPPVANLQRREYSPGFGHPSPKPVGVMRWMVAASTAPGDTVCDPFMGSGTAGVAAHDLGRGFIGIEKESKYFDLACERIEDAQRQDSLFPQGRTTESPRLQVPLGDDI